MTDSSRPSRRTLLGTAATLGTGIVARVAIAAPVDVRPRIERFRTGLLIYRGVEVTELRFSLAGVASVIKCPLAKLASGGGLFAARDEAYPAVLIRELAESFQLIGQGIIAAVDKRTGLISFCRADGQTLIAENGTVAAWPGVVATRRQGFKIDADSALHGLGQFREPVFDYRDQDVFLAHANSDAVNPLLVSTAGWGLLWDTGTAAQMRCRATALDFHSVAGDIVRYHVCLGPDIDAVIGRYRALTGAASLLPRWAYGYWQSKERYASQAELVGVVDGYRRRDLPLDAVVLDWRYWGENDHFSGMTFDPTIFPDPKAMVAYAHTQDVHTVISCWSAFGKETAIYREMAASGFLFSGKHWSGGRVFDASAPAAREIYWRHVKRGLIDVGFDGLWTDGNEPEFQSTGERYGTTAAFAANGSEAAGPIAANLLTYSFYQVQGLSRAMARDVPGKRPVLLSRSAYAGQQAFGSITWSGDIFASWGTLSNQIVAAINFSMSGNPWWTCDIGGFLVNHRYPNGLADPAYKELYVRWFQFGAFLPVFRAHGTHIPREVWQFGDEGDPFYDALVAMLRLRYALLPYIYSLAARVALNDDTLLRGLAMDFPSDRRCQDEHATFMFGHGLLVRVVDRPLYHATTNIQEFLPSRVVQGIDAPAATVEYFSGSNFELPVSRRLTDDLKMSWSGDLPLQLADKPYSVRWTGHLAAQESGRHTLVVMGKGSIRLMLDGQVIVDGTSTRSAADGATGAVSFKEHDGDARFEVDVTLTKGRKYPFRLEQRQPVANAVSLWVEWITPSHRECMRLPTHKAVEVYLPYGTDWYDFYTGRRYTGGRVVTVSAPLERIPVFARAGAIVPMSPKTDRSSIRPTEFEIRVYAGRDGEFTIFDDTGDSQGFSHGEAARIPLRWDEYHRRLYIGQREGSFPGMHRTLKITARLFEGDLATTRVFEYVGMAINESFDPKLRDE